MKMNLKKKFFVISLAIIGLVGAIGVQFFFGKKSSDQFKALYPHAIGDPVFEKSEGSKEVTFYLNIEPLAVKNKLDHLARIGWNVKSNSNGNFTFKRGAGEIITIVRPRSDAKVPSGTKSVLNHFWITVPGIFW